VSIGAEGPSDHGFHPSDAEIDLFRTQNGRCVHFQTSKTINRVARDDEPRPGEEENRRVEKAGAATGVVGQAPVTAPPAPSTLVPKPAPLLLAPAAAGAAEWQATISSHKAEAEAESPQDNIANITVG